MLRKCANKKMLRHYPEFRMQAKEARAFTGNIRVPQDPTERLDVLDNLAAGEIQIYVLNKFEIDKAEDAVVNAVQEIMGFGLTAIGKLPPITLKKIKTGSRDAGQALKGVRDAYFDESGGYTETRIYDGDKMLAGNILEGPCVVEERMTNVVIPPGYRMQVDEYGSYVTLT